MDGLTGRTLLFLSCVFASTLLWATRAHAEPLPNPPAEDAGLLGSIGIVSVLESIAPLPSWDTQGHQVQYTLPDGTRIGGLLYIDYSRGMRPLVIADFGLMSSTDSALAADVIEQIVEPGMLNANFLVVDDISGADFYVNNRSLSLGGYDAGRILNQLADTLKADQVPFSHLTLLGESLGGLAVLEALVEDQRIGAGHFQSAITFSGVTDELQATGTVMSAFGHNLSGISGPPLSTEGTLFLSAALGVFDGFVLSSGSGLTEPAFSSAGNVFYDQFTQRLQNLRAQAPSDWNPSVSSDSVEWYLASSARLASGVNSSTAPVIMVHAQNDPVVAYSQFQAFADAQYGNPRVQTLGTPDGSHCGFVGVYGASWVAGLINRAVGL